MGKILLLESSSLDSHYLYQLSFAPNAECTSSSSVSYILWLMVSCMGLCHGGLPEGGGHAILIFISLVPDIFATTEVALDLYWTAGRLG